MDRPAKGEIHLTINGVDQWDVDDIEQSKLVEIGDLKWQISAEVRTSGGQKDLWVEFACKTPFTSSLWSSTVSVRLWIEKLKSRNEDREVDCENMNEVKSLVFDESRKHWGCIFKKWDTIIDPEGPYVKDRKLRLRAEVIVGSTSGIRKKRLESFDEPKENLTDVVLIVENKKVHVCKQILAMSSKYFHTLFFQEFAEKEQKEVKIEDVVHSEFIDLLQLIYPTSKTVSSKTVSHLLKLADRFDVPHVTVRCERFLKCTHDVEVIDKLIYAENYKLSELQSSTLDSLKTKRSVVDVTEHRMFQQLGHATHSLLLKKLVRLTKEPEPADSQRPAESLHSRFTALISEMVDVYTNKDEDEDD